MSIEAVVSKDPDPFVGRRVTVSVTSIPKKRDGFHTQVSVEGELEKHPSNGTYRVLVSDGNYAYFRKHDIESVISALSPEWNTRTGSVAVIYLEIGTGR